MAPDAPTPTRNDLGDIVGSWMVTARYDEAADRVYVTVNSPGGRWRKARSHTSAFAPHDLEDVIHALQVAVRTLGARRLF